MFTNLEEIEMNILGTNGCFVSKYHNEAVKTINSNPDWIILEPARTVNIT